MKLTLDILRKKCVPFVEELEHVRCLVDDSYAPL
jgi:hypothetical protein